MNSWRHSARGSTGTSMSSSAIGLSNVCFSLTSTIANFFLLLDEHLLAVEGDLEPVGIVEDRLLLARLQIEVHDRALLVVGAGARRSAVEQLALHRLQIGVAARLRRQHHRRAARSRSRSMSTSAGGGGLSAGFSSSFFSLVLVRVERRVLGVVARRERRLHVLAAAAPRRAASGSRRSTCCRTCRRPDRTRGRDA